MTHFGSFDVGEFRPTIDAAQHETTSTHIAPPYKVGGKLQTRSECRTENAEVLAGGDASKQDHIDVG